MMSLSVSCAWKVTDNCELEVSRADGCTPITYKFIFKTSETGEILGDVISKSIRHSVRSEWDGLERLQALGNIVICKDQRASQSWHEIRCLLHGMSFIAQLCRSNDYVITVRGDNTSSRWTPSALPRAPRATGCKHCAFTIRHMAIIYLPELLCGELKAIMINWSVVGYDWTQYLCNPASVLRGQQLHYNKECLTLLITVTVLTEHKHAGSATVTNQELMIYVNELLSSTAKETGDGFSHIPHSLRADRPHPVLYLRHFPGLYCGTPSLSRWHSLPTESGGPDVNQRPDDTGKHHKPEWSCI